MSTYSVSPSLRSSKPVEEEYKGFLFISESHNLNLAGHFWFVHVLTPTHRLIRVIDNDSYNEGITQAKQWVDASLGYIDGRVQS